MPGVPVRRRDALSGAFWFGLRASPARSTPKSRGLRGAEAGLVGTERLGEGSKGFVRTRLSAHEYPREIAFVEELPLTTTGKVVRRVLRERG